MKTLKSFAFFLLVVSTSAYSQIEVTGNGKSKIGNPWPYSDYNNECTIEVLGLNSTSYRPGGRIAIGDYGSTANGGNNVSISESWGWDSDQLSLHGKNGIYFTIGGTDNIIAAEIQTNGDLRVLGGVYSNSTLLTSDIRLKTNVRNLNGSLASVLKLQGIAYDFKSTKEDTILANLNSARGSNEKEIKDLEKFKKIYENKKQENLNQIGFSAQEVQKIFPQLVKTDEKGYLAVNYVALVPVAVEAIKEQQKTIDDQAKTIDALQKDIIAIKKKIGMQ